MMNRRYDKAGQSQRSTRVAHHTASQTETWIARELAERVPRRATHQAISKVVRGREHFFGLTGLGNTKAAYRFLSNHRVTEGEILAGHFQIYAEAMRRHVQGSWSPMTLRNSRITESTVKPWVILRRPLS
jgi:hypothetical protein